MIGKVYVLTGVSGILRLEGLKTRDLFDKSIQKTNRNWNVMEVMRLDIVW